MAYHRKYRQIKRELQELFHSSSEEEEDWSQHSSKIPKLSHHTTDSSFPGGQNGGSADLSPLTDDDDSANLSHLTDDVDSHNHIPVPVAEEKSIGHRTLEQGISRWATKNNITRQALNELLQLLREEGHDLPKDSRILMNTPRYVEVLQKCGGHYFYYGIESCVQSIFKTHPEFIKEIDSIKLSVNIDGIPLYKSSSDQFWPILIKFDCFRPALVALYCGKNKPNSIDSFLEDFLQEYKQLSENGLFFAGKRLGISIVAFICDAPARSFIKCIKGHTGYYSCERCEIKGTWDSHVLILDSLQPSNERTDDKFSQGQYEYSHQLGKSPLIQYGISCVKGFPLDYMHNICLGVTRRMLAFLIRGPRKCRLSQQQIKLVSASLEGLSNKLPSEFARQPRSLALVDRWKATEFRQYILYTSIVVLKDFVPDSIYKNSLSLTVALSVLLNSDDDVRKLYLSYARELLKCFVDHCRELYGRSFIVYNVHNVLHLADDVENYQCSLNDICAFPYENELRKIKQLVRSSNNPISQVFKRLAEKERSNKSKEEVALHKVCVSTKPRDNCFILENKDFVFLKKKIEHGYYECDVLRQSQTENFFTEPCSSKLINIAFMKKNSQMQQKVIHSEQLCRKVVKLPYKDGLVLAPVLHDITK